MNKLLEPDRISNVVNKPFRVFEKDKVELDGGGDCRKPLTIKEWFRIKIEAFIFNWLLLGKFRKKDWKREQYYKMFRN